MSLTSSRSVRIVACAAAILLVAAACSGDDGDDAAGTSSTATATASSGEFSVLSYNVAGLPAEISGGDPGPNMPIISPLLNDYEVVLTQEDFDWWPDGGLVDSMQLDFVHYHERLRADATHGYQSPRHPGPEAAGVTDQTRPELQIGDGIGIMATLPLDDYVTQAWVGCFGGLDTSDGGAADCPAMKGFRVATMDVGGAEVDVYSLHAEAGGTETDQALQADDFDQLAAFVAEHSAGRAVIVGGDTNLHTDGEHEDSSGARDGEIWEAFLAEVGLTDTCAETDCDDPGAIDKIAFRSSDVVELTVIGYDRPQEKFSNSEGEDLSDHVPTSADFTWRRL